MSGAESLSNKEGLSGKIKSISNKLAESPLLLAFLMNLAAFLFRIVVFEVKYEVSDDYFTDAVLSGAYGVGYDPNLLFGNVLFGYFLVFLYRLIPVVSFYFVTLILLGFISTTVVLYLLFKKSVNVITVSIAILFLSFVTDDLYVLIQFTKASTAAGIAGGLLIIHALFEVDKKRVRYMLSGFLLMLAGSMVRFTAIYIYAVFLVIVFLCYGISFVLSKDRIEKETTVSNKLSRVLVRFIICVCVFGSIFGFYYLGQFISNSDKNYEEYYKFSQLRSSITDITTPNYKDVKNDYEALGLNSTDYVMLNAWAFDDKDIYNDELLQTVADVNNNAVEETSINFFEALHTLAERRVFNYPVAIALYVIAVLALFTSSKKISPFILILVSFAYLMFFIYFGRTVYRVEWSIYCSAVFCLVAGYSYDVKNGLYKLKARIFGKDRLVIPFLTEVVVITLLCTRLPRMLTRPIYLSVSDEEYSRAFYDTMLYSGEYIPDKIGFPTVSRKPTPNLIAYLESDTDCYYYVDFATGIQNLYYNYDPWIRPEQGLFCYKYSYFGSCMMRNPGEMYALEYNGCDPYNPFMSLTNDNILLIDSWGSEFKLDYVRRYYCPDAECELVDVIDGYYIWNIYDPNSIEETYD